MCILFISPNTNIFFSLCIGDQNFKFHAKVSQLCQKSVFESLLSFYLFPCLIAYGKCKMCKTLYKEVK